jgi:hypothetical protein
MIAESLKFPKAVVLRILKVDMGKRNLFAWFVPHTLTPEQKEDRVTSCHLQEFLNPEDETDRLSRNDGKKLHSTRCLVTQDNAVLIYFSAET